MVGAKNNSSVRCLSSVSPLPSPRLWIESIVADGVRYINRSIQQRPCQSAIRRSVCLVHHFALRLPLNEYFQDRTQRLLQLPEGAVMLWDATGYHSSSSCQLQPEPGTVFRATCCPLYYRSATTRLMENAGNVLLLPKATPKLYSVRSISRADVRLNNTYNLAGSVRRLCYCLWTNNWQTARKFQTRLFLGQPQTQEEKTKKAVLSQGNRAMP